MFWGLTIQSGFQYTQSVTHSYHVSKAVLEVPSSQVGSVWGTPSAPHSTSVVPAACAQPAPSAQVQLWVKHFDRHYQLAHLDPARNKQVDLNLNFTSGEQVTYYINGSGVVHLSGYMLEFSDLTSGEQDEQLETDDEEDLDYELDGEEQSELSRAVNGQQSQTQFQPNSVELQSMTVNFIISGI